MGFIDIPNDIIQRNKPTTTMMFPSMVFIKNPTVMRISATIVKRVPNCNKHFLPILDSKKQSTMVLIAETPFKRTGIRIES